MRFVKKEISVIVGSILFTLVVNFLIYNFRLVLDYVTGMQMLPFTQHPPARFFCYFLFTLLFYTRCKPMNAFWVIFSPVLLLDSTTLLVGREEIPLRFPFDTLYPFAGIICGVIFHKTRGMFWLALTLSFTFMVSAHYFIRPAIRWQMKQGRTPQHKIATLHKDSFLTTNGTPVQLGDTSTAIVQLIELYFVGCAPCEEKYNVLKEIRAGYKNSDLQIVLICDGNATSFPNFIKHWEKNKLEGITFLYDSSQLMRKYGVGGYPTEFLFDRQKLIHTDQGFGADLKERWLAKELKIINQIIDHE
jgi:hypothetical protein